MSEIDPVPVLRVRDGIVWKHFQRIWLGAIFLFFLILGGDYLWILSPLRLFLGLCYTLFVPGYCLMMALFPREEELDGIERVGVSIGLSVAIVPLLALLLDWLPWGIGLWPIMLGEYGIMALCMAVALWRWTRLPSAESYAPQLSWHTRSWWHLLPLGEKHIYTLLASALVLLSFSVSWIVLVPSPEQFMTEFYLLGQEGMAENYPRTAELDETILVTMGLTNKERQEMTYRVEVWVVDSQAENQRGMVGEAGPVTLLRGEEREWPIEWQMPWAGEDQTVEFYLFEGDNTEPYRQLRLWLNVVESQP